MKILQINSRVNKGSVSRITEQIGCMAIDRGWQSFIAYGRQSGESKSQIIKIGNRIDVYTHYLGSLLFDRHGLYSTIATRRLIKDIERIKPDIIQLQNIHGYYLNYEVLFDYLNSTSVPVVWTLHDCWAFTGHCSHFIQVGCEKWKSHCSECRLISAYPRCIGSDNSYNNFERKKQLFSKSNIQIVTVSDWLGDLVKESFLGDKDVTVINNGIDLSVYTKAYKEQSGKFRILGVATAWTESKGISYYNKLANMLELDEEIVLVGVKDKDKSKLASNIICIPPTKNISELARYYQSADVLTSFSSAETFGLTIAEALACGTPAIVFNNTAQKEHICEDNGFLVENGDLVSVRLHIDTIKRRGRNSYSDACSAWAQEKYDKIKCFDQYFRLYESLVK